MNKQETIQIKTNSVVHNDIYKELLIAYRWYNFHLFDGELPETVVTLQRKKNSYGYYCATRFSDRNAGIQIDEIALNPMYIINRTIEEVLGTLVHEMCHVWHYVQTGKPTSYHDKKWADKMEIVGLMPTTTGLPGGAKTGHSCTHYIIDGGRFARYTELLLMTYDIRLNVGDRLSAYTGGNGGNGGSEPDYVKKEKEKAAKKVKAVYICSDCKSKVWGKPGMMIGCMSCDCEMVEQ